MHPAPSLPAKAFLVAWVVIGLVLVVCEWGRRSDRHDRDAQLRKLVDADRPQKLKRRKTGEWERRLRGIWLRGERKRQQEMRR